jgi:hypothetical protein
MTQSHTTGSDEQMSERNAFEAWARSVADNKFPDFSREGEGYWQKRTDTAWTAWQARAALSQSSAAEAPKVAYTDAMGEAGTRYLDSCVSSICPSGFRLPATFRWHELWDAMLAAAPNQPAAIEPVAAQAPKEITDALNWTIAHLYLQGEIGRAEKLREATKLLASQPAPATGAQGDFSRVDHLGLALELESAAKKVESNTARRAMEAGANGLRLALASAQPIEHKPVAWTTTKTLLEGKTTTNAYLWFDDPVNAGWTPLYTAPQQSTAIDVRDAVISTIDAMKQNAFDEMCARPRHSEGRIRAESAYSYAGAILSAVEGVMRRSSPPATEAGEQQ